MQLSGPTSGPEVAASLAATARLYAGANVISENMPNVKSVKALVISLSAANFLFFLGLPRGRAGREDL